MKKSLQSSKKIRIMVKILNKKITCRSLFKNNELNSEITFVFNSEHRVKIIKHYKNGIIHRDENLGPAIISYRSNNKLEYITYVNQGKLNRLKDSPTIIMYNKDGKVEQETYYKNGIIHRNENLGPAIISYDKNGLPMYKDFYNNGRLHKENGPASIRYRDGKVIEESYVINNKIV